MRTVFSLNNKLVGILFVAGATLAFSIVSWIHFPTAIAHQIALAIETKDFDAIRTKLGDEALESIRGCYPQVREKPFTVHLKPDDRTLTQLVTGNQSFLISGYGGAHRFRVARGQVSDFRYTFISGGLEYTR